LSTRNYPIHTSVSESLLTSQELEVNNVLNSKYSY